VPSEKAPLITPSIVAKIPTVVSTALAIITVAGVITIAVVGIIAIAVVDADITVATDSEVNGIIDSSTLGNWHEHRLVICSGGDRRHPVCASRETLGDIGGELAVGGDTVETLEESENTRVAGLCRIEGCDLFNDDVVVSDNLASVVQLLRCSVVGVGSVGEGTGLHSVYVHDNGEWGVRLDITTVGWELELDGRHVVDTGNITHRRGVARASFNLLAICDGLTETEGDEVVGADEGVSFAVCQALTIDVLNDSRVQGEGGLRIVVSSTTAGVPAIVTTVVPAIVTTVVPAIVATIIPAVVAAIPATTAATAPIVLTGYKTARLWDKKGDGELGNDKGNERELKALHGSCPGGSEGKSKRFWSGRNDGVGSKQASLSKRL
jgi:hypothetical protein